MESVLIIDLYNTVIRSLAVHQDLSFNDVPTGGLFGVVNQLANMFTKYEPTYVIVCKDSPPYLRREFYPEYKQDRKKNKDEKSEIFYDKINISVELVRELLALFHIPIWEMKGMEADDLIAALCLEYQNSLEKIYVLSNDDDLFQLLDIKNLVLIRKNKEYTVDSFKEEYPTITPLDWILVTALSGTHNGVKGLKRVGIKTAIKYLGDKQKLEEVYNENKQLIESNMDLILLPFVHSRIYSEDIPALNSPKLNETALIRYLNLYGIRYANHMVNAFYQYSTRRIVYV